MSRSVELFVCPSQPGELRLTVSSCIANYRRGKYADPCEAAYRCRGCEVGATHAGEKVISVAAPPKCRICGPKGAGRKTVYGCLCISCYNRLAEAFKEKNAKGKQPRKLAGERMYGLVVVARENTMFAGRDGALAWMARAPGRLPTTQWSLFDTSHHAEADTGSGTG